MKDAATTQDSAVDERMIGPTGRHVYEADNSLRTADAELPTLSTAF